MLLVHPTYSRLVHGRCSPSPSRLLFQNSIFKLKVLQRSSLCYNPLNNGLHLLPVAIARRAFCMHIQCIETDNAWSWLITVGLGEVGNPEPVVCAKIESLQTLPKRFAYL